MLSAYRNARAARHRGEQGFTLVEVMVVVLIIGILLAIGIPTFLGARSRAQDRAVQSNLRIAQNTALILFTDDGTFTPATADGLKAAEPQIEWVAGTEASKDDKLVSVGPNTTGTEFGAAAMSDSGMCYYVRVRADGATLYGKSSTTSCNASNALAVKDASW